MKSIAPLWRGMALLWWKRALKEINPLHPDVPRIIHRINELESLT